MPIILFLTTELVSQHIVNPWALTVGSTDVTAAVLPGASFVETASSSSGFGNFTLNGTNSAVVQGASVTLTDPSGTIAWEGTVSAFAVQNDLNGFPVATLVQAAPLAAAFAAGTKFSNSNNTDAATVASQLAALTNIPWGGPADFGITIGALAMDRIDGGLTALAWVCGQAWRVQNGQLIFTSPASVTHIPVALSAQSNSYAQIGILGGADATTRQPLEVETTTLGDPAGATGYLTFPQISDYPTLDMLAGSLAEAYGSESVSASASNLDATLRAGDWVSDQNQVVTITWSTNYSLGPNGWGLTATFGYPALSTTPLYSGSFSDAQHRYPVARVTGDYVVTGGDITSTGTNSLTLSAVTAVIANTRYTFAAAAQTLAANATAMVIATPSGIQVVTPATVPAPGVGVALWRVTTNASGGIVGSLDQRSHGGVNRNHLWSPSSAFGGIQSFNVSLAAEGQTQAVATVTVTLNSAFVIDDSIESLALTWAIQGTNQWHPPITTVRAPNSNTFTGYIHGLAAQQGYDIGFQAFGYDGTATPTTPALISPSSPTVSSGAIVAALTMDSIADGLTYIKMPAANMDQFRNAIINCASNHFGSFPSAARFLNQGSIVPVVSNFLISCQGSWPSVPSYNVRQIGYSWPAWEWLMADGTNGTGNPYTQNPNITVDAYNNPITSPSYYVTAAYNWGSNGIVTTFFTPGPISLTVAQQFMGDGRVTLQVNQGPISIPTSQGTVTGGFTPHPPQCPAVTQPITTRERGTILAGMVRPGEHVLGPNDNWVLVTRNQIMYAPLLRVVIDGVNYDVERGHLFLTDIGWWPTHSFTAGDQIRNGPKRHSRIAGVQGLGLGAYAKIEVEGSMLRLSTHDRHISHNYTYITA